ncbi:MAG TPA: YkgJ family cysteine cluster protein [Allosphingosinicella sp.]|jgi:Fe-S-cluster containining protein|nr:YkgJ family cysteine cluster protein [Allosphingosinicella sp.]
MIRSERRRQAKEDSRAMVRGLDAERPDGPQIMILMRLLHDRLEEARAARSIAPLSAFFGENLKAAWRAEPRMALGCRMGCAHCCKAWVSAKAPEVLIARRAIPPRDLEAVKASVAAAYARTGAAGPDERAAMAAPCPMLEEGRCRIYAGRPAACRTAVSLDAALCAEAFRPNAAPIDIPTPEFHIVMRRGYAIALAGAMKRSGFPAASYEFVAAMRAALARDDSEAAWLAGEDLFAGVQTDPGSDPFDHPRNRRVYELAFAGW